jgi:hypothetical protein
VACNPEKRWHRCDAAKAAAPAAAFRGLCSSSSAMGGVTAPRDLNVAPALDTQTS